MGYPGSFGDAVTAGPTVGWAALEALGMTDDGVYPITLRVSDKDGGFTDASGEVRIANTAPTAAAGGDYEIDEGADLVLDGSRSMALPNITMCRVSSPSSVRRLRAKGGRRQ